MHRDLVGVDQRQQECSANQERLSKQRNQQRPRLDAAALSMHEGLTKHGRNNRRLLHVVAPWSFFVTEKAREIARRCRFARLQGSIQPAFLTTRRSKHAIRPPGLRCACLPCSTYCSSTPARAKRLAPFSSARLAPSPDGPITLFVSPRGETCRLDDRSFLDLLGIRAPPGFFRNAILIGCVRRVFLFIKLTRFAPSVGDAVRHCDIRQYGDHP